MGLTAAIARSALKAAALRCLTMRRLMGVSIWLVTELSHDWKPAANIKYEVDVVYLV